MPELGEITPVVQVAQAVAQEQEGREFEILLESYDTRFDEAYEKALGGSQEAEAVGFSLDEITADVREERLQQLKTKLGEYTDRLHMQWSDSEHPPLDGLSTFGRYKRDTLRLAISRGTVNTWALSRTYAEMDGGINGYIFENACSVVHAYIRSGGVGITGGTGLPQVSPKA